MSKSTVKGLVKYLIAVALLALVVSMNWTGLKELFSREPHFAPLIAMFAISVTCSAIQFVRWYLLVRALDLPFTIYNAVRLGLVGLFYNTFLPGSVGGDVVKAYFIAKGQPGRKAAAVATVVADRLIGLFGLILFAAAVGGGCWLAGNEQIGNNPKLQSIVLVCVALASTATVGYVLLGLLPQRRAERFAQRLRGLKKVGPTLEELWYTLRTYRERPGTVIAAVAMSAVVHTGFVAIFHLSVHVFPPEDLSRLGTFPEHFVIAPIGYIVQALIPLPGGLGGGELTFGGLYRLIRPNGGESIGLGGRLTMRLVEWTIGLIGYIAFLRMRNELPVPADDAEPEPERVAEPVGV